MMMTDIVDFEFEVTYGRQVPKWAWRKTPWRGQTTRAAITHAYGEIPDGMALETAFQSVSPQIAEHAAEIVRASVKKPLEPIVVEAWDLI